MAQKKRSKAVKKAAKKSTQKTSNKKAKTVPLERSVESVLTAITHDGKRDDARRLIKLMRKITRKAPRVWGGNMIGFGSYHYKYESGREGDMFVSGFAPRAQNLVVYVMQGFASADDLMPRLGKFKTGKSCLYLKRLDDVDQAVLEELITRSVVYMRGKYECR
ncbi:MAG: DUF1801 domain-containing protein [bacterium]|nr:DUF1801 domain-containing protein [bacterium]